MSRFVPRRRSSSCFSKVLEFVIRIARYLSRLWCTVSCYTFASRVPRANYADYSQIPGDESLADSRRGAQNDLAIDKHADRVPGCVSGFEINDGARRNCGYFYAAENLISKRMYSEKNYIYYLVI